MQIAGRKCWFRTALRVLSETIFLSAIVLTAQIAVRRGIQLYIIRLPAEVHRCSVLSLFLIIDNKFPPLLLTIGPRVSFRLGSRYAELRVALLVSITSRALSKLKVSFSRTCATDRWSGKDRWQRAASGRHWSPVRVRQLRQIDSLNFQWHGILFTTCCDFFFSFRYRRHQRAANKRTQLSIFDKFFFAALSLDAGQKPIMFYLSLWTEPTAECRISLGALRIDPCSAGLSCA